MERKQAMERQFWSIANTASAMIEELDTGFHISLLDAIKLKIAELNQIAEHIPDGDKGAMLGCLESQADKWSKVM